MNLLPINFIQRHQAKLLFTVIWVHVTILDLFYVAYSGPIFFINESLQMGTLFIHLIVATLTLLFYFMLIHLFTRFRENRESGSANVTQNPPKPTSK